ncbi:MAG: PD40 domain-containing protein [Acidobacteria bacterium]|nr:PD40 domain-containing protein [Acidobacteriota bacterium]
MAEGTTPARPDRLDSWKEIAAYLGKGVRTVQRWEAEGLPVRRLGPDRAGPVFAYKEELDTWWREKSGQLMPATAEEGTRASRVEWIGVGLLGCVVATALALAWRPARAENRAVPFTAEHGWEMQPAISPDGLRVAYVGMPQGSPGHIYLKPVNGERAVRLTDSVMAERFPAWSPDGRMIAYFTRAGASPRVDVMLIPATGGKAAKIAETNVAGGLVWSPEGRWLTAIESLGKSAQIVAISATNGEVHVVVPAAEFGFTGAAVMADGKRMIFGRGKPGSTSIYEIPLGDGLRPVGPERMLLRLPEWTGPTAVTVDGEEIYYSLGTSEEGMSLWRSRLTPGAKPELVYETTDKCLSLSISSDKRRVVFATARTQRHEIWKLKLGGAAPVAERLPLSTHSDLNPDYSPDGSQIAFHSTRSGASDIWVTGRDGSNARRLTFTNARTTASPRWSPDGEWIAYESNEDGQTDVYVIRANGGPARRMTDAPGTDAIPAWSRDGKWIYFCSDRTGRFEIWRVPAGGGAAEQVTREGGFAATESRDGKYLYYTQTRNFGPLLRRPVAGGAPEMVAPEVRRLFYAVVEDGVYFQRAERAIYFWDAVKKQVREVYRPEQSLSLGMAAAPDGKEILYTQVEGQESDLQMIVGLR